MKHPNAVLLTEIYSDFTKGNFEGVVEACAPAMTFQLAGKSPLAGKFTRETFVTEFCTKLVDLSSGTFKLETHDIMATDLHGVVLGTSNITRHGKTTALRTVHVWRFENGKPIAWYEYPRDLYQFDATWTD